MYYFLVHEERTKNRVPRMNNIISYSTVVENYGEAEETCIMKKRKTIGRVEE
jgi:hypothetical protein